MTYILLDYSAKTYMISAKNDKEAITKALTIISRKHAGTFPVPQSNVIRAWNETTRNGCRTAFLSKTEL